MSEQKKEPRDSETTFLPPLNMYLAFLDKDNKRKKSDKPEDSDEKKVEKLIEKLSESEKEK
jgi:hypothetical protein